MAFLLPLCVLLFLAMETMAFNIETNYAGYFEPQKSILPSSKSISADAAVKGHISIPGPTYFGSSFAVARHNSDSEFRFIVTSPKSTKTATSSLQKSGMGNIQHCHLGADLAGKHSSCTTYYSNYTVPGDGFGLTAAIRKDGNVVACSPMRKQKCGQIWYLPGYCYKSADMGVNWIQEKRTKNMVCPASSVDVLFVLDGSSSVGTRNFDSVKLWVKNIVQKLNIKDGRVSVGIVQYSHYNPERHINRQRYIKTEIRIGQHKNYFKFARAVDRIFLQSYTTFTAQALKKVVFDFNNTKNFGAGLNKQVMILLTDGRTNKEDSRFIPAAAEYLREDMKVVTYAIGVGDSVAMTELKIIANGDKAGEERVLRVKSFSALDKIVEELQTDIQSFILEGEDSTNTGDKSKPKVIHEFSQQGLSVTYGRFKSKKSESL